MEPDNIPLLEKSKVSGEQRNRGCVRKRREPENPFNIEAYQDYLTILRQKKGPGLCWTTNSEILSEASGTATSVKETRTFTFRMLQKQSVHLRKFVMLPSSFGSESMPFDDKSRNSFHTRGVISK